MTTLDDAKIDGLIAWHIKQASEIQMSIRWMGGDKDVERAKDSILKHINTAEALRELKALREALAWVRDYAKEAAEKWDSDEDAHVGKMLLALEGRIPGYRKDTDAFHALFAKHSPKPADLDQ